MTRAVRGGFNLLEVVVALVLLQVSLLGVLGLFSLAAGRLTRALLLERAAAEAAAVADSLSRAGGSGEAGESVRGEWRVTWEPSDGGALVRVARRDGSGPGPLVEMRVP
jgi:hypothetical protein